MKTDHYRIVHTDQPGVAPTALWSGEIEPSDDEIGTTASHVRDRQAIAGRDNMLQGTTDFITVERQRRVRALGCKVIAEHNIYSPLTTND